MTMTKQGGQRTYTSAIERLRSLPAVFSVAELTAATETTEETVRRMLKRWRDRNLIAQVGPHVGIYFNLVREPNAKSRHFYEAVLLALPSAVIVGASAIHDGHWTTQIPHRLEVAVMSSRRHRTFPQVFGVDWVTRPREWYATAAPFMQTGPLPILSPEAAVADAWIFGGGVWQPDPDDLDVDFDDDWKERLMSALLAFGMDEAQAEERIGEVERYGSGQRP